MEISRKKKCEVMVSVTKEESRSNLPFKLYLDLDSTKQLVPDCSLTVNFVPIVSMNLKINAQ